jgi:hypothetical protein
MSTSKVIALVIVVFLSACTQGKEGQMKETMPVPEPVPAIQELREMVFSLHPEDAGISPSAELPTVWGVVMETGYPQALATLISLADGTTSLYLGTGGGVIGGGEHEAVRDATIKFLKLAQAQQAQFSPVDAHPLPAVGHVTFYLLTYEGTLSADAEEKLLGEGDHRFSNLFYAGQDVLTQLRETSERSGTP